MRSTKSFEYEENHGVCAVQDMAEPYKTLKREVKEVSRPRKTKRSRPKVTMGHYSRRVWKIRCKLDGTRDIGVGLIKDNNIKQRKHGE